MRLKYYITSLLLYPLCSFSNNYVDAKVSYTTPNLLDKNTIERSISNEQEHAQINQNPVERSMDFPTQVIRMTHTIENQQLTCAEVNEEIDKVLINKITKDKFLYTTYISCTYNPDTSFATQYTLSSYFDPLSDEAISYLKTYLDECNGIDLLGNPLAIESAKGLIVSLNISVGSKKNPKVPPFIVYKTDHSNFYFKNNYEVKISLVNDIKERFFSDDPGTIMPFLDKWIFNHAGIVYKAILRDSNYVLLEPERIFLMDNGEAIYISLIKTPYPHDCSVYEHHYCLKQDL
jgi:hypothetical protein